MQQILSQFLFELCLAQLVTLKCQSKLISVRAQPNYTGRFLDTDIFYAQVVNECTRDKTCARVFTTRVHAFMHKSL